MIGIGGSIKKENSPMGMELAMNDLDHDGVGKHHYVDRLRSRNGGHPYERPESGMSDRSRSRSSSNLDDGMMDFEGVGGDIEDQIRIFNQNELDNQIERTETIRADSNRDSQSPKSDEGSLNHVKSLFSGLINSNQNGNLIEIGHPIQKISSISSDEIGKPVRPLGVDLNKMTDEEVEACVRFLDPELLSHLHRVKSGGPSGGPNIHVHLSGNLFSNTAEMEKVAGSSGLNGFGRGRGAIRNR
jgi:hypothetical protein